MNTRNLTILPLLVVLVVAGCKDKPEPPKPAAATPSATTKPSTTTMAAASSAAPKASASAAPDEGIGAAKYAVCAGQGGNAAQLAPGFLDKMPACEATDTAPADKLAERAGDGKIIEGKGDCQFGEGISCHFHTSMEFVSTGKLKDDEHAVGELHCIVPSSDANSPTVFGAHLRCKAGTTPEKGTKACSKELLHALDGAHCKAGWKCCDNGTLTKPVGKQADGEKKLRPDFRICSEESIEIDCGLLHEMHGHTANVTGLGEEYTGKFNPGHDEHEAAGGEHDEKHEPAKP